MSNGNPRVLIFVQLCFIAFDLSVNQFLDEFATEPILKLVILVLQLVVLLLSLLFFLLSVFNTYPVQTGYFRKMISKFKGYYLMFTVYLGLTITLNALKLSGTWSEGDNDEDNTAALKSLYDDSFFAFVYCVQRLFTPIYYYTAIRSHVRIGDMRFYDAQLWAAYVKTKK